MGFRILKQKKGLFENSKKTVIMLRKLLYPHIMREIGNVILYCSKLYVFVSMYTTTNNIKV